MPRRRRRSGRRAAAAVARGSPRPEPPRAPRRPLVAPRLPWLSRLRDRVEEGEFLRLRGRFRGRRGIVAFLAVMGPGLIAGIAGNDAGGITTYSVLGAKTGLTLLWIFPITFVILAVVQEMAARLGVVTGQGLSDLIRDRFGVRWTVFAMVVLLVANVANTVAEFAGTAAALEIFGIPRSSPYRSWPSRSGRSCCSRATGPWSGSSCRSRSCSSRTSSRPCSPTRTGARWRARS